jgi:pyruvate dehydrogenase E1 component
MPNIPEEEGIDDNIMNGMYRFKSLGDNKHNLHLLGSGAILLEVLRAAEILKEDYSLGVDVWSVTSYKRLYDNAIETDRRNRSDNKFVPNFIQASVGTKKGIFISASDYVKAVSLSVASWFPGTFVSLGTDGFGISDHRNELREHFEVSAHHIVWAALTSLRNEGKIEQNLIERAKSNLHMTGEETF